MYSFRGVLDLDKLDEVKGFMLPKKYKLLIMIYGVICAILAIIFFISKDYLYGLFMLAMVAFSIFAPKLRANLSLKREKARYMEVYKTTKIEVESIFEEDEIKINNITSGGKASIDYQDLVTFKESDNYLYLSTQANQFIVIEKSKFKEGEQAAFEDFLKSKNPVLVK